MSQTKLLCTAQIIVLAVLLIGCGKKATDEIDFGAFNNSVYTNNYFGLTVTIPTDWSIQDQAAQRRIMNLGEKIIAGDDKAMKTVLKAAELQMVNLFAVYKYPLGTPVTNNPAIMAMAERVSQLPGIKRGKDYLFQVRQTLESGQMQVSFPKDVYTQRLGGVDFDVMDLELSIRGIKVKEKYFATVIKGYALSFIVMFKGDEEEPAQQKILDSLAFK
jgi:hypothetical protein